MSIQRVLVFCGSSPGLGDDYMAAARDFGARLAAGGLGLVYGGARVGLMGALADAVLAGGGEVTGVIPHGLADHEIVHRGLTELHLVETMHERKALMLEQAQAVVALPGGAGTLDELFEAFTWAQLGLHHKPIAMLEVSGYWGRLLAFLDHAVQQRLLSAEHRDALIVETDPDRLLARLTGFHGALGSKWIDRES